jgi:hypothetical protein
MDSTCQDHQAAYLAGEPTVGDHLATCATCQADQAGLDDIRRLLGDEATWVEPPADLLGRVVAATSSAASAAPVDQTGAEAPNAVGASARATDELGARRTRRAERSRRGLWLAAAACLAGGLIGAGGVALIDRPAGFPQQAAIAGTTLFPHAHATAHIRPTGSGTEIELHISGLPRAPAGSYYQAWVKGPQGPQTLVPIGTFHTGNGTVILWSGVSLASHPTLTVTIQSATGDQASSGRQVLIGTVGR